MTVVRFAIRLGAVLVCAAGWAALPAAPAGAAPGFNTSLTQLPGRFVAGAGAQTVTAVVSTSLGGDCRKVRWSMVVQVRGVRLSQIGVDRIEETGSFPLDTQAVGGGARLTDRQLDPGTLCRNRTVTAQYRVAVDDKAPDGRLTLAVEAYDANGRLLDRASANREVIGSATDRRQRSTPKPPRPTPTAEPTVEPTESLDDESPVLAEEGPDDAAEGGGAGLGNDRSNAAGGGGFGLVQVGFVGGGLLLFLGVGLLLRLWTRNREEPVPAAAPRRRRPGYPAAYQTPAGPTRRPRGVHTSQDW